MTMLLRGRKTDAGGSQNGGKQFNSVVRSPPRRRVTVPSPFVRGHSPTYESEKKNAVSPFGSSSEYVLSPPVHPAEPAGSSPLPGPSCVKIASHSGALTATPAEIPHCPSAISVDTRSRLHRRT